MHASPPPRSRPADRTGPAQPRPGPRRAPHQPDVAARQLALDGAPAAGRRPRRCWSRETERPDDGWLAARGGAASCASATPCSRRLSHARPAGPGVPRRRGRARRAASGCVADIEPPPPAAPRPGLRRGRAGARRLGVAPAGHRPTLGSACRLPVRRAARRGAGVADRNRLESGRWQRCQPRVRIPPPLPSPTRAPVSRARPARRPPGRRRRAPTLTAAHGAGGLGDHRDLHLHRLQQHDGVAGRDRVARRHGHAHHVRHHLREDLGHLFAGHAANLAVTGAYPARGQSSARVRPARAAGGGLLGPARPAPRGPVSGRSTRISTKPSTGRRQRRTPPTAPLSSSAIRRVRAGPGRPARWRRRRTRTPTSPAGAGPACGSPRPGRGRRAPPRSGAGRRRGGRGSSATPSSSASTRPGVP